MMKDSQTYRRDLTLCRPPPTQRGTARRTNGPGDVVVTPLSGPSYGPFEVVKRRWRKPLSAMIADTVANSEALLARLERGLYCPDEEGKAYYKECLIEVCKRTREQLAALEAFRTIDWRE
jgi:hypothetical protein